MSSKGDFAINEAENQFELHVGDEIAFLEFVREDNKIFLTHTEVPEELRGRGIAAQLVEKTLQYCKDNGLTVVPACSYVAKYIDRNPHWIEVLSDGYQM